MNSKDKTLKFHNSNPCSALKSSTQFQMALLRQSSPITGPCYEENDLGMLSSSSNGSSDKYYKMNNKEQNTIGDKEDTWNLTKSNIKIREDTDIPNQTYNSSSLLIDPSTTTTTTTTTTTNSITFPTVQSEIEAYIGTETEQGENEHINNFSLSSVTHPSHTLSTLHLLKSPTYKTIWTTDTTRPALFIDDGTRSVKKKPQKVKITAELSKSPRPGRVRSDRLLRIKNENENNVTDHTLLITQAKRKLKNKKKKIGRSRGNLNDMTIAPEASGVKEESHEDQIKMPWLGNTNSVSCQSSGEEEDNDKETEGSYTKSEEEEESDESTDELLDTIFYSTSEDNSESDNDEIYDPDSRSKKRRKLRSQKLRAKTKNIHTNSNKSNRTSQVGEIRDQRERFKGEGVRRTVSKGKGRARSDILDSEEDDNDMGYDFLKNPNKEEMIESYLCGFEKNMIERVQELKNKRGSGFEQSAVNDLIHEYIMEQKESDNRREVTQGDEILRQLKLINEKLGISTVRNNEAICENQPFQTEVSCSEKDSEDKLRKIWHLLNKKFAKPCIFHHHNTKKDQISNLELHGNNILNSLRKSTRRQVDSTDTNITKMITNKDQVKKCYDSRSKNIIADLLSRVSDYEVGNKVVKYGDLDSHNYSTDLDFYDYVW